MSTLFNSAEQVNEPAVFRRRSTVITGSVIATLLLVLTTLLTLDGWSHGFFAGLAGPVIGLTLGLLAVFMSVWPHVIVREEWLEPHNSFIWYRVPYPAIASIGPVRMGLVVRTHERTVIPLSGYASGSGARLLRHSDAADAVVDAVEAKMARSDQQGDTDAPIVRRWERRNAYAMLAAVVLMIVVIILAVMTYH